MAAILYRKEGDKIITEKVNPLDVASCISQGYRSSPSEFAAPSREELKKLAESLGIKVGKKSDSRLMQEIEDAKG